jgi:hypothetical protein
MTSVKQLLQHKLGGGEARIGERTWQSEYPGHNNWTTIQYKVYISYTFFNLKNICILLLNEKYNIVLSILLLHYLNLLNSTRSILIQSCTV